ncbi:MAG TPA: c-type cytochrome [Chitinophagaceae bacterium]|nr:c-type cytochrome [Chitinophagaceae bacterium]
MQRLRRLGWLIALGAIIGIALLISRWVMPLHTGTARTNTGLRPGQGSADWHAPSLDSLPDNDQGRLIRYGHELIVNTAYYLGPRGRVAVLSNGMNCGNCHIEGGTRPFGNCFSAVAANYPSLRYRSGRIESIEYRVNDCLLRSLNGRPLDSLSQEMRAIVAYLTWLGSGVPLHTRPRGAGLEELPYLDRAADTARGRRIYMARCTTCHGPDGAGLLRPDSLGYTYPPLWGPNSFNTSAGMYQLSRFSAYIKYNMPFGLASRDKPALSDQEAWDVAAYVNSRPRPVKRFAGDWPDLDRKPVDYPFGPYRDTFPASQHKYGPFGPILAARRQLRGDPKK